MRGWDGSVAEISVNVLEIFAMLTLQPGMKMSRDRMNIAKILEEIRSTRIRSNKLSKFCKHSQENSEF